jgi:hypothetical protein
MTNGFYNTIIEIITWNLGTIAANQSGTKICQVKIK